jgi:hypothetical protein
VKFKKDINIVTFFNFTDFLKCYQNPVLISVIYDLCVKCIGGRSFSSVHVFVYMFHMQNS